MVEVVTDGVSGPKPSTMFKSRALHYANVKQANKKALSKVIDEEKNFNFRSYRYTPRGISMVQLFEGHN